MSGLIQSIVILLISSLTCGLIASAINLPPAIGYMVSGVFLGSFMSGSANAQYLTGIEDIPLIMLMFLAGLELEIAGFVKSAKSSMKFAVVHIGFITLLGISALMLPKTFPTFLIKEGYLASMVVLVCLVLLIKGRQIQNFAGRNELTNTISILMTLFSFWAAFVLILKIHYEYSLITAIKSLQKYIYIPLALLPLSLRLPYKKLQYSTAAFMILITVFTLYGSGVFLSSISEQVISNKTIICCTSISSLILFLIPTYINNLSVVTKYIISAACFMQMLFAILSFFIPSLECFTPLISMLKPQHMQIFIMMVGLFALHSTAIAFKLMETKPVGHVNDVPDSLIVKPIVTSILIAQDLIFVAFVLTLKGFGDNLSLIKLLPKIGIATLLLYVVKKISKAQPSFITQFLDHMRDISMELITLFSITFCLACAFLGDLVGLSDLYGAFIAGLLLGNVYQRHKLVIVCCEPLKDLLMVLFFMRIGLDLKFDYILKNFAIVSFINLVIIVAKYTANYYSGQIAYKTNDVQDGHKRFDKSCLILMSVLMTQVTEFFVTMINIVKPAFANDMPYFFEILESSCIVSLTLGCLCTVLFKRYLYHTNRIHK